KSIHKLEQVKYLENLDSKTVLVDIEDETSKITEAAKGVDAVVFTAGSGPSTGPDKTMLIDLDGAVKTIDATKEAGVNRFIMVSSFETDRKSIREAIQYTTSFA